MRESLWTQRCDWSLRSATCAQPPQRPCPERVSPGLSFALGFAVDPVGSGAVNRSPVGQLGSCCKYPTWDHSGRGWTGQVLDRQTEDPDPKCTCGAVVILEIYPERSDCWWVITASALLSAPVVQSPLDGLHEKEDSICRKEFLIFWRSAWSMGEGNEGVP